MAKFRIQFTKYGDMKYVSHLDLIRLFTRIFHRAGLPVAYSEGFNPHPKMSVLLPLSVGTESACEYMDVEFQKGVSMLDCMKKLKGALPIGMEIPQIGELNETSAKPKEIRYAKYEIHTDSPITDQQLDTFLDLDSIEVMKKTKRSEGIVDIKPDIMYIGLMEGGDFTAIISAGSSANLKCEVLLEAMKQYIDGFSPEEVAILRTGILNERGEPML